ncbi:MAG: CbtB-domain containing protein [Candidatus Sphingomonas phytovorans]|nr:CbtB-domain containing protein [Sphingomonas sp.]WEK00356.1 MAG: CbtB-domain containing protein [Sphingomonas sp.]
MPATTLFADDVFIPVRGETAIPFGELLPWALFGTLLAVIFLYFVSTEQGAVSLFSGKYVHELVHDGRHLLGFPCH